MNTQKANKNKHTNTIIVIFLLVILLISSIFITISILPSNVILNKDMIEIPRIKVSIQSSSDGSNHSLTADFYVDIPKENQKDISSSQLETDIVNILEKLDYKSISLENGLDTVTSQIQTKLRNIYPDIDVKGVYASTFLTDASPIEPTNNDSIDSRLKRFQIK